MISGSTKDFRNGYPDLGLAKTKLQSEINGLYRSNKDNFENEQYAQAISRIAGKRGLSHEKRSEKIRNWFEFSKGNLSKGDKKYTSDLLKLQSNYIKNNKVKDSYEVRKNLIKTRRGSRDYLESIKEIRKDRFYERIDRNSEINEKTQKGISRLSEAEEDVRRPNLEEAANSPDIINISEGKERSEKKSWYNKAGFALKTGLVTLGIGVIAGLGGYFIGHNDGYEEGVENQKQKIEKNEGAHKKNLKEIASFYNEQMKKMSSKKKKLKNKLEKAGRLDEEVRKEALENKVEGEKFDVLHSNYEELNKKYEELKQNHNKLESKYGAAKKEMGSEIKELKEENSNDFDLPEYKNPFKGPIDLSKISSIVPINYDLRNEPNNIRGAKDRKIKRLVNEDSGFNDYGRHLGRKGAEQWKDGRPVESGLTGIGSWFSLINETVGRVVEGSMKWAGGVSRTIEESRLLEKTAGLIGINKPYETAKERNTENPWKKGVSDAEEINDFFWRNTLFGPNWNKSHSDFLRFLTLKSLDFKSENDPYVIEDGLPGAAVQIGSDVAAGCLIDGLGGDGSGGSDGGGITGGKSGSPGGIGGGKIGGAGGSP